MRDVGDHEVRHSLQLLARGGAEHADEAAAPGLRGGAEPGDGVLDDEALGGVATIGGRWTGADAASRVIVPAAGTVVSVKGEAE